MLLKKSIIYAHNFKYFFIKVFTFLWNIYILYNILCFAQEAAGESSATSEALHIDLPIRTLMSTDTDTDADIFIYTYIHTLYICRMHIFLQWPQRLTLTIARCVFKRNAPAQCHWLQGATVSQPTGRQTYRPTYRPTDGPNNEQLDMLTGARATTHNSNCNCNCNGNCEVSKSNMQKTKGDSGGRGQVKPS